MTTCLQFQSSPIGNILFKTCYHSFARMINSYFNSTYSRVSTNNRLNTPLGRLVSLFLDRWLWQHESRKRKWCSSSEDRKALAAKLTKLPMRRIVVSRLASLNVSLLNFPTSPLPLSVCSASTCWPFLRAVLMRRLHPSNLLFPINLTGQLAFSAGQICRLEYFWARFWLIPWQERGEGESRVTDRMSGARAMETDRRT